MGNCTTSMGWLDHSISSPSMSLLSRLVWPASRIVRSDCTKRLFAKQTNIGVTLSYGLVPETPSLCNHHCWHAKPAPFPHTMTFIISCWYTHLQVMFFSLCLYSILPLCWLRLPCLSIWPGLQMDQLSWYPSPLDQPGALWREPFALVYFWLHHFLNTSQKFWGSHGLTWLSFRSFSYGLRRSWFFFYIFISCSMSCWLMQSAGFETGPVGQQKGFGHDPHYPEDKIQFLSVQPVIHHSGRPLMDSCDQSAPNWDRSAVLPPPGKN